MATLIPRPTLIPDMFRLLEEEFGDRHHVRIEDYFENGTYVLRAELPGMDPENDIHVTVQGEDLSVTAERAVIKHDKAHSEFAYGAFARHVRLPAGADAGHCEASYDAGILEIRIPVHESAKTREIPVTAGR